MAEVKKKRKPATTKATEWLTEDRLLLLSSWARDMSLQDVAAKVGVAYKTFWEWCKKYPEIQQAVSKGRELVDYEVENALLRRALGYKVTETKTIISNPDGNGNRVIKIEKTEKELPPDVTAIFGWLNNRKPNDWKRNRDNFIELNDSDNNITVNIVRNDKSSKKKQQEESTDEEWDEVMNEFEDEGWDEE